MPSHWKKDRPIQTKTFSSTKEIVSECAYIIILAKPKHQKKTWKKKKQLLDFFRR